MEDLIEKFHSPSAMCICMSIRRHDRQKQAWICLEYKTIRKTKSNKEVT